MNSVILVAGDELSTSDIFQTVRSLFEAGADATIVIDTAHGHSAGFLNCWEMVRISPDITDLPEYTLLCAYPLLDAECWRC